MKEKILRFERGPPGKKYTAIIQDKKTKTIRNLHFGASDYEPFQDRTPLHLYPHQNHTTLRRMQTYFS